MNKPRREYTPLPHATAERLLEEWQPFFERIIRRLQLPACDRDDALQEARLVFIVAYPKFPGGNLEGWLTTILRRKLIDRFIRYQHYPLRFDAAELDDDFSRTSVLGNLYQMAVDDGIQDDSQRQAKLTVDIWLDQIPNQVFAEAVRLVKLNGMSYPEAARHEGVAVGTMKSRVSRGMKHLQTIAEE